MYSIIDIETTGGKPGRDKITEISIYNYDGDAIVDSFTTLINPHCVIPPYISRLTGISQEMVSDAPPFYKVAKKIIEITTDNVFVAHNVRFDYSFIKREFKDLGYNFQRKRLCTQRLSQRLMPGIASYSLKKLCKHLDIPLENHHRAQADAFATTQLFASLLNINKNLVDSQIISDEIKSALLPKGILKKDISSLPEQAGIYFFYDKEGSLLYIGKSNNIKKRVSSHFQLELDSRRTTQFKDSIAQIEHEKTGSELIALIREAELIKDLKPLYNVAQKTNQYNFAIYNGNTGEPDLVIDNIGNRSNPIFAFKSKRAAKNSLYKIAHRNQLCKERLGFQGLFLNCTINGEDSCKSGCSYKSHKAIHELGLKNYLNRYQSFPSSFILFDKGRADDESSFLVIHNKLPITYGYLPADLPINNVEELEMYSKPISPTGDMMVIVNQFLVKNNRKKWIPIQ